MYLIKVLITNVIFYFTVDTFTDVKNPALSNHPRQKKPNIFKLCRVAKLNWLPRITVESSVSTTDISYILIKQKL